MSEEVGGQTVQRSVTIVAPKEMTRLMSPPEGGTRVLHHSSTDPEQSGHRAQDGETPSVEDSAKSLQLNAVVTSEENVVSLRYSTSAPAESVTSEEWSSCDEASESADSSDGQISDSGGKSRQTPVNGEHAADEEHMNGMVDLLRAAAVRSKKGRRKKRRRSVVSEKILKHLPLLGVSKSQEGTEERERSVSPGIEELAAAATPRRMSISNVLGRLRQRSAQQSAEPEPEPEPAPPPPPGPTRHVVLCRRAEDEPETPEPAAAHQEHIDYVDLSRRDGSFMFVKFFAFNRCYDVMPNSGKIVVLDADLSLRKAFDALVLNEVRAAPLWDAERQRYVGMVTVTDLLHILTVCYSTWPDASVCQLQEHSLLRLRTVLGAQRRPLLHVQPDTPLEQVAALLLHHHIHRLPVIEQATGDLLYVVTHKRLLGYLQQRLCELPRPRLLDTPLGSLQLGTYQGVQVARPDTPLLEALRCLLDHRISALPLLDPAGRLLRVCTKFDLFEVAVRRGFSSLEAPLAAELPAQPVVTCRRSETLGRVLRRIARAHVRQLMVVNRRGRLVGVVSSSDLLAAFMADSAIYRQTSQSPAEQPPAEGTSDVTINKLYLTRPSPRPDDVQT